RFKLLVECVAIGTLIVMNLRGVKESIKVLVPIFVLFLITHAAMLLGVFIKHFGDIPTTVHQVSSHVHESISGVGSVGIFGLLVIIARAYSQGAGTFAGIEAVSNGLAIMREPKVQTGKRTMVYMAISLAVTAGGILLCYLLANVHVDPQHAERPLNAVLLENLVGSGPERGGPSPFHWFLVLTLISEAALLFIAAQTGFIDGPRVMANMALDSWLPHRFSSLSERLTTHYGVIIIGFTATAALIYTALSGQTDQRPWTHGGNVDTLVVM